MTTSAFLQTCRGCQREFRAPASLVGKTVACPHCKRPINIIASAPLSDDRLVGRELGGCRLSKRLGAGAIGVVYEAEQLSVGRPVAVKMLTSRAAADAKVVQRFQREAKLCAAIQHPNVVSVYDCGFERGVHYLIMEYVDGSTLAGMIEEAKRLPWQHASRLVLQVARALEHVHGIDIIHRDIKPANILVNTAGTAKLADLGLAKQMEDEGAENPLALTMQGVALGSPAYMPPEQIRSAKDATKVSDLYALGATLYECITGDLPFSGRTGPEVMTKVLREPPRPARDLVPDLPPAITFFLDRVLQKEPRMRPQSASQFIVELEDALNFPDRNRSPPASGTRSATKANTKAATGTVSSGARKRTQKDGKGTTIAIIGLAVLLAGLLVYLFVYT